LRDFRRFPVVFKGHASERLRHRFGIYDEDEAVHYVHVAKVIVPFGKDGGIGKLRCDLGDRNMVFVCTISEGKLVVITVE